MTDGTWTLLALEGDRVDLSPVGPDTDDQQLSLNGTVLELEDGGTVDLEPLLTEATELCDVFGNPI